MQQNKFSNQKNKGEKRMIGLLTLILAIGFAFAYNNKREEVERIKKMLPENIRKIYFLT